MQAEAIAVPTICVQKNADLCVKYAGNPIRGAVKSAIITNQYNVLKLSEFSLCMQWLRQKDKLSFREKVYVAKYADDGVPRKRGKQLVRVA